jgi:hypothetical protein
MGNVFPNISIIKQPLLQTLRESLLFIIHDNLI